MFSLCNDVVYVYLLTNSTFHAVILTQVNCPQIKSQTFSPISLYFTVPPTAPRNVTATVLSATSVSLTWSHPSSNGGTDITNYIITYWSNAEDRMTVETNSVSLTIQLYDLAPYTAYQFLVSAENAIGTGPASVTIEAMTLVGGKCRVLAILLYFTVAFFTLPILHLEGMYALELFHFNL